MTMGVTHTPTSAKNKAKTSSPLPGQPTINSMFARDNSEKNEGSPNLTKKRQASTDSDTDQPEKYRMIEYQNGGQISFSANITTNNISHSHGEGIEPQSETRTVRLLTDQQAYSKWANQHEGALKNCLKLEETPNFNKDNNLVFSNMYQMVKLNCFAHNNQQNMFNSIQTSIGETNIRVDKLDEKLDKHTTECEDRFRRLEDNFAKQETDRQNRAPAESNTVSDIVRWNNRLLNDIRKASRHGRIFGLNPANRSEASQALTDFMTKVYNGLNKGPIPPYRLWALERKSGSNEPIVVFDANPEVVSFMPTLGSEMHKIYPSPQNAKKSLVYVQEENCVEFRPMRKRFNSLTRDMRALDAGFTRIKIKVEAMTMVLSYKKDKSGDFKPVYSYKPKYIEDPADKHPFRYLDSNNPDYLAKTVLFRPSRNDRSKYDVNSIVQLLSQHAQDLSSQCKTNVMEFKAKDGTVIGYHIELNTLKAAEQLYDKCGPVFTELGIETSHYGNSYEKKVAGIRPLMSINITQRMDQS